MSAAAHVARSRKALANLAAERHPDCLGYLAKVKAIGHALRRVSSPSAAALASWR